MISRELNLRLGDILIQKGTVTRDQLEASIREQKKRSLEGQNRKIGGFLIEQGLATENDIAEALAIQFNLPVMHLNGIKIKQEVLDLVTELMAKRFNLIPIFHLGEELTVAVSDPTDINVLDVVGSETGCKIVPVIAPYTEVINAIAKHYTKKVEAQIGESLVEPDSTEISRVEIEELKRAGVDIPIIKIVDRVLIQAVEEGVSDVHIEPRERYLSVRFRVDGILREVMTYPVKMHPGVVSRIKILSFLDISERHKPQDGRIKMRIDEREIDIRVSMLPTYFGEKVVMRLLNRSSVHVKIEELGLSEHNLAAFGKLIREPYGIVLVTGPTGSGKTTTLYAALNEINSIEKNIITIEDPIEYQLPIINQTQLNPKKELTFANALRAILRQDPDIIMVGEIRDPETASIAAESALTGHLVFSTLHTNDAVSSLTRLTDMGVEPFLLAPSLLGIMAQRLVRKICTVCKEEYTPSSVEFRAIGMPGIIDNLTFYRGRGCESCNNTGYRGRTGIHELLVVDRRIRELITTRATIGMLHDEAAKSGFKDMRFDGIRKVVAGATTVEELIRVTRNTR